MMEQREKLIELLCEFRAGNAVIVADRDEAQHIADYLLANGVLVLPYKAGDKVWIMERDACGDPYDVSGYIFLTECLDYVIVSPSINGSDDIRDIVECHAEETTENYYSELPVFPAVDCYASREEAEKALAEQGGGDE